MVTNDYSLPLMITETLRADIDKQWQACWPTCDLRPLILLDLLSYLLFIKKLDDSHTIAATQINSPATLSIFAKDQETQNNLPLKV